MTKSEYTLPEYAASARRTARDTELSILRQQIQLDGERPVVAPGDLMIVPEGTRVLQSPGIGDWFVIGPEWIWYVRDDDASDPSVGSPNVRGGGQIGAIGWRIPYDAAIAARLRALA